MTLPPAGWYADPVDSARLRWWDGTQWTQATTSGSEQAADAAAGAVDAGAQQGSTGEQAAATVEPVREPEPAPGAEPSSWSVAGSAAGSAAGTSADPSGSSAGSSAGSSVGDSAWGRTEPEAASAAERPASPPPSPWTITPDQGQDAQGSAQAASAPSAPSAPSAWGGQTDAGQAGAGYGTAPGYPYGATSGQPAQYGQPAGYGQGVQPGQGYGQGVQPGQGYGQGPGYGQPGQGYGQPAGYGQPGQGYAPAPGYAYPGAPGAPAGYAAAPGGKAVATPDGQPLGGLGARLGARFIDGILLGIVVIAAGFPLFLQYLRAIQDYVNGPAYDPTNPFGIYTDSGALGPLLGFSAIGLIVSAVYSVGFVGWKGGTPGKLMLGLRIRPWDRPGRPTYGQAFKRWFMYEFLAGTVGGLTCGIYTLLDVLWPLWDQRKQALHDKWPGTVVVKK